MSRVREVFAGTNLWLAGLAVAATVAVVLYVRLTRTINRRPRNLVDELWDDFYGKDGE